MVGATAEVAGEMEKAAAVLTMLRAVGAELVVVKGVARLTMS